MNITSPLVSVVIPCYNHEQFVQDSIQSVIDQTYENIELIIIDDGSTDNSVSKIQEMVVICEQRFVNFEFRSRLNVGLSATLNESLEWCRGKYYSAIASDDEMLNEKTTIQVSFLEKNLDCVAVFGGIKFIDSNGISLNELLSKDRSYNFKEIIMHEHDLPAPTQMVRLNIIKDIGGYNSSLFIEDWYMWLKLSMHGHMSYISHTFCLYRRHDSNISKNLIKMHQGRLDVLACFKDYPDYEKALANIHWKNSCDDFVNNKTTKKFLKLFFMNPLRLTSLIAERLLIKI